MMMMMINHTRDWPLVFSEAWFPLNFFSLLSLTARKWQYLKTSDGNWSYNSSGWWGKWKKKFNSIWWFENENKTKNCAIFRHDGDNFFFFSLESKKTIPTVLNFFWRKIIIFFSWKKIYEIIERIVNVVWCTVIRW